jgi:hypothetical protein
LLGQLLDVVRAGATLENQPFFTHQQVKVANPPAQPTSNTLLEMSEGLLGLEVVEREVGLSAHGWDASGRSEMKFDLVSG